MTQADFIVDAGDERQRIVRIAARSLARASLVHAYGHCSLRLDARYFLVCAAKPMGLINPGDPGTVVPVDGELPQGVLGEVRIHQQIYKNRPEVGGVVRSMPRDVTLTLQPGSWPLARRIRCLKFSSPQPWPSRCRR